MRILAALLLVPVLMPPPAAAQRLVPPAFPSLEAAAFSSSPATHRWAVPSDDEEPASDGELIVGSLLGGLGTFWLGAYLGSRFHGTPCEDCGLEEGLYGAALGFGLGAATGAHFANDREGRFGPSALAGMAIGAAGVLAAIETDTWEILLAIPIAQIASAVMIERRARVE
jgi:hypothetical protein